MHRHHRFPALCAAVFCTVCLLLPAAAATHPDLLFDSIADTPGYQHRTENPWKTWEAQIITSADRALSRDFTAETWPDHGRVIYRSEYARDCALAYQITKKAAYLDQAREALRSIGIGEVTGKTDRALALGDYALAYDWVRPALSSSDDAFIRGRLATLADTVYAELNDGGANRAYVTFADYHGQAYPNVAIAGAALDGYANPALASGPDDWLACGTTYLFEDDALHAYGRSLFSFGFDEASGKHLNGAYKAYVADDLIWWAQVANHAGGTNLLDRYPAFRRALTAELWESLPNYYHNNYGTSGNTKEYFVKGVLNLLSPAEQAYALRHIETIEASRLLPYAGSTGDLSAALLYCTYPDLRSIPRSDPPYTSRLDAGAVYQVFRSGWDTDAAWLSLVTFNAYTRSNRDSAHHDQLSIEYYSGGDLLLADAGETKYLLDRYYGEYDIHHNSIMIGDPGAPFAIAPWSGSTARGTYKGDAGGIATPVAVGDPVEESWMEWLEATARVTTVIGTGWLEPQRLSTPVTYSRAVLFAEKEYFVIIDRFSGSEPWEYRTVLRPASLSIVPSEKDGTMIGHVQGSLAVGKKNVDWLAQPYKEEKSVAGEASVLSWKTTSPAGTPVEMTVVSAPAAGVRVTKHLGRIAGYSARSEVYSPVVALVAEPAERLDRVTVLTTKAIAGAEEVPVDGTGHAVRISSGGSADLVFAGAGGATVAGYATDGDVFFLRTGSGAPFTDLFLRGTVFSHDGVPLLSVDGDSPGGRRITITGIAKPSSVTAGGQAWSDWSYDPGSSALVVRTDARSLSVTVGGTALRCVVLPPETVPPLPEATAENRDRESPLSVPVTAAAIAAAMLAMRRR